MEQEKYIEFLCVRVCLCEEINMNKVDSIKV
jgi:hypothetical protein